MKYLKKITAATGKPVWVVSYKIGSNQEVLAVFSSKSEAEKFRNKRPDCRFIEESKLDPEE